jgi:hypothetical protein
MLTVALTSGVIDVAFSPEGWRFATASEGGWLELWHCHVLTEGTPEPRFLRRALPYRFLNSTGKLGQS